MAVVMDLEGREFGLLAHLLDSGALALIDRLYIHWHLQHRVRSFGRGVGQSRCQGQERGQMWSRARRATAVAGPP